MLMPGVCVTSVVTVEDCGVVWSSVTVAVFAIEPPASISAWVTVCDTLKVCVAPIARVTPLTRVPPVVGSVTVSLVRSKPPVLVTTIW